MASTIANYQGNGSTTDFNVPFDYLAKKFVKVTVDSREKLGGDYGDTTKDYFFVDKTTIRFNTAPASGTEIIIRRYTSATDRSVSFKDASVLKAKDLDVSTIQTIHIAEEGRDVINDALIVNKEGNWDAKGKRITNVGAPVADSDAVTYGVYKTDAKGAYQAKLDAERARDRAILAETNAKNSEVNSKRSEDNAKLSEVTAQASAGTAVSASKHADAVKVENQAILNEAREIQTNVQKLDKSTKENATIATTKAEEAKVSAEKAKESEKVVTGIAGTIVPIAPEIKVVADNIDYVVTDYNNIDKISIVGTDLEGALHDSTYDDYGDLGNPEAPLPEITGGNIKVVADNIEDVKTVAGVAPDFNKLINSVGTVTKLTVRAETAATKSEASATQAGESEANAKESEKVVTGIAGTIVPIAPEIKVVADNIDYVVTDYNNIDKISIVGTDLEGALHDSTYDDYGDLGNPEAPLPEITGGNIKVVADNIEDVKTVAGVAPDFNKLINSVGTVTKLTVRAETAATKSEASATQAGESEANAMASEAMATDKATEAKDWANKMDGTVDDSEYSAKYYANKAKTEGGQAVETAKTQALQQITTAKTTAIKEIGDKGTQQKALLDTQVAEATRQAKLAEASAVASEASAKNSADSASTASAQATIATNKATEAKNSADKASLSKDAAKTSENNAKKYADSAASVVSGKLDKAVFDGFVDYGDLGNQ